MSPASARRSLTIDTPVSVQVFPPRHWNRRAPSFDEDFGHSIRTDHEGLARGHGAEELHDDVAVVGESLDEVLHALLRSILVADTSLAQEGERRRAGGATG